ncbi:MAG: c-type cytochrome [Bacteroidota bacterium]
MKKLFFLSLIIAVTIILTSFLPKEKSFVEVEKTEAVAEVLKKLGDSPIQHQAKLIKGASAEVGEDLALYGIASKPGGGKTKKQSRHFVCTSCHNTVKDKPDLRVSDPQAKLEYAQEKGLPFLQGTSLYGIVNRTSYYNGDYDKKYGDLVKPARHNLREAIQLCAIECAQGRKLKNWEVESVLAWLWTMELKMLDLNLTDADYKTINAAINGNGDKTAAIELIKSYYQSGSPATFIAPPKDREKGYGLKGDPKNGKLIYELSCQYCHKNKRYSYYNLDDSKFSLKHLNKHIAEYSRYSIYQVSRYGTPPMNGKKAYMPQYTQEKMSDQMMEDLRAYIESRAK